MSALNPLLKPALKSLLSSPAKNLSSPPKPSLDPDEDGSETDPESDHEFPPADAKKDIRSREGEGDEGSATESEEEDETESSPQPSTRLANSLPSTPPIKSLSKEDREIKPNLIPRADQTARGKFVLKRPKECYDGTPVAAGSTNDSVPASVNRFLRDYQREGIQFFYDRWCEGRGGVLGDDMGLDNDIRDKDRRRNWVEKWQRENERKRNAPPMPKANFKWPTALIIVPKTLIDNWERELDTWGYFEVGTYRDANERADVLTDFRMGRLDILLTSYELVRQNIDKFESLALSVIFLDEAHKIKNSSSTITKNFMRFDCLVRFGLTGTALQNDYAELWTLLDWTNPGRLGTRQQWKNTIVKPLKAGQSHTSSAEEQDRAIALGKAFSQKLLPNFLLRRTKDLIKHQLPNKTDDVIFCPLTTIQLAAYKNILNSPAVHGLLRKDDPCDCEQKERSHELLEIAFPNQPNLRKRSAIYLPNMCGKWNVLKGLLHAWHNAEAKNKVLIFSKSVKLLKFLETEVEKSASKMCYLDGQTKSELRMPLVDSFNNDPNKFIFLISTTAGGTGLNLTSANRVVIFDPHWNPAHDLQAMDRAYRYGQTRDVYVIRLLGAGALEELIYARQIYKQQQMNIAYEGTAQTRFFEGVHGDKTKQGELFGLKNIFSLQPSAYATKHVIERARVEELEWALTTDGRKLSDDVRRNFSKINDKECTDSFSLIGRRPRGGSLAH
ncbi:hypothetical protein DL93DRAFT_2059669 [Clavulina sp. PMI_390]|nr:hypothetical protein DL93DRAFT_2059669 [Clavulina sp. PMI_390]